MGHQQSSQGVLVLVFEGEIQSDAIYPLSIDQEIIIGRDSNCDIPLDFDSNISRRHASIRPLEEGGWEIIDHNSSNGTYINGQRLQGKQLLHPGDRVMFSQGGPEFVFEYHVPIGISAEQSQPEEVSPRQTIDTKQYRLEILPRQLIIQIKGFWWSLLGSLVVNLLSLILLIISLVYLYFGFWPWISSSLHITYTLHMNNLLNDLPSLIILLVIISTIVTILRRRIISYQLDLDTKKFTIASQSFFDKLFSHYRYQSYLLEEFIAVRLQKSVYKGDGGTRYDDFNIELVRENNKILRLDFVWREYAKLQFFSFFNSQNNRPEPNESSEANELMDWIQKYLEHE